MDQVKNVSDKYNNVFTVYNNMDMVILHIMIYYKHDIIIMWIHVTVIIFFLTGCITFDFS